MDADALLDLASPTLAALYAPARVPPVDEPGGALQGVELRLDGTTLSGRIRGLDLAQAGAKLLLDTRGGPAPDLEVSVGQRWARFADVRGWKPSGTRIAEGSSEVVDDHVDFRLDLGPAGYTPGHNGWISASVGNLDRSVVDVGPGGFVGSPAPERAVLDALASLPEASQDPDLTVAVSLGFSTFYALVDDTLRDLVIADATAWLRYGLAIDPWLKAQGATWRLGSLPPEGKLVWAWPGGQSAVYGVAALGELEGPMSAEQYRFVVPDAATLLVLRDAAPIQPELAVTADLVDRAIWDRLRYRASPAAMDAWCSTGNLSESVCRTWEADVRAGFTLGTVDGEAVPMDEGTSATLQLAVFRRHREYIGDCATATALTMTAWQALGIAPIGLGWNGATLDAPTHDLPLFLDGGTFQAPQSAPSRGRSSPEAWVYVTLPVLHPGMLGVGWEPGGGTHGGAVAGGHMRFDVLARELTAGLPLATVAMWMREGAGGTWPGW